MPAIFFEGTLVAMIDIRKIPWTRPSTVNGPCPLCGRMKYCEWKGDRYNPLVVLCTRTPSKHPTRDGEGWLHYNVSVGNWKAKPLAMPAGPRTIEQRVASWLADRAKAWHDHLAIKNKSTLDQFATYLGVDASTLIDLWCGWSEDDQCYSFPMYDARHQVVGVRLRRPDGQKLAARPPFLKPGEPGGTEGIFWPRNLARGGLLVMPEGPTDTAALMSYGIKAVGRPNNSGGYLYLAELLAWWQQAHDGGLFVLLADNDPPNALGRRPGLDGAMALASKLTAFNVKLAVVPDPFKDVRQMRQAGVDQSDIDKLIASAI